MSNNVVLLTPALSKAVANLCDKAQVHGLMADQGSREDAEKAAAEYEAAKLKLEKMIFSLQKSLRKANAPFRSAKANHNVF